MSELVEWMEVERISMSKEQKPFIVLGKTSR
jgi:hypothetical protein